MLFGVAIFSYIMGIFITILDTFKSFDDDIEDGESLIMFLGTLKKFNNDKPIDLGLKTKIEEYFDFRWMKDMNTVLLDGKG